MTELFLRLDRLRKAHGITLKKMGDLCGISPQGVQSWKTATEIPSQHLTTLAAYFGTTVDYLLGRTEGNGAPYPEHRSPAPTVRESQQIDFGAMHFASTRQHSSISDERLVAGIRESVEAILKARPGRARLAHVRNAVIDLLELQERCIKQWGDIHEE